MHFLVLLLGMFEVYTDYGSHEACQEIWNWRNFKSVGKGEGKGKVVPLQAWSGPEVSRKLRFQDFVTSAQDGDKVVSLTHRPFLLPRKTPGTHARGAQMVSGS